MSKNEVRGGLLDTSDSWGSVMRGQNLRLQKSAKHVNCLLSLWVNLSQIPNFEGFFQVYNRLNGKDR